MSIKKNSKIKDIYRRSFNKKNTNNKIQNIYRRSFNKRATSSKIKKEDINKKEQSDYYLIQISANNSKNKTPPESKTLLDNYSYKDAIKYDKRSFCRIYYICIIGKENLLNFFLIKSPLELKSLRILIILFIYSCDLALNTLFYFNDNISDRYHYKGDKLFIYTIFNNISISIISTLISLTSVIFLEFLTNSKDSIEDLFRNEEKKMRKNSNYIVNYKRKKEILITIYEITKKLKIKIVIFIIIEFSMMLFFYYFVTSFCEVYKETQVSWIFDSIVSFLLSFPIELGTSLIITIFYKIAIKKKLKWLYKLVMIIYNYG